MPASARLQAIMKQAYGENDPADEGDQFGEHEVPLSGE